MATPQINTGTDVGSVASSIYGDAYASAAKLDKRTDEGIKKMESEKIPSPPELKESPNPKDFQTDQMQTFGSAAMFIAAFGSLLTKTPLETALNSGASVLNAYHKNDAAAFNQAFNKWKVDNDNAWKVADYNQQLYKDVLGKDEAELKARAVSAKDEVMLHMADAKMAHQLYSDREKQIKKGQSANQAISDYVDSKEQESRDKGMNDEQISLQKPKWFGEALSATKGKGAADDDLSKIDWKTIKPEDPVPGTGLTAGAIKIYGDAIVSGAKPSALGLGYGMNPVKKSVDNYVASTHPGFKMADAETNYLGQQKEASTVGTSAGRIKLAANSLDQAIPLARNAMQKVDLTSFPSLNAFENYARAHTGDPNITALNTAIQTVISDYSSLIARNGQQTDSTRAASRELVNSNMASGQLDAFFDQVEKEKDAQLKAIDVTQGKGLAGKAPDKKHIDMLKTDPSEQNKKYFDEAFGNGEAAKVLGE